VAFSYPFNLSGHPAISVPIGLGDDGLPIGLQIVTERHTEERLLRLARVCEQAVPFSERPAGPAGT
jgi:Asp-tRNA(Asn)/Glu-tRNA(Gln) amidotransferase A subunit family amidase